MAGCSWVNFLEEKHICYQDEVGNMPCDYGVICDKCQAEWIQKEFESWKKEKNK